MADPTTRTSPPTPTAPQAAPAGRATTTPGPATARRARPPRTRWPRRLPRPHRAWLVAAVAGAAIVTAGTFTTVPGLLHTPLNGELGWERGEIALAASVTMVLFGLTAPFAAALMDRLGIRKVVTGALALLAAGALLTSVMTEPWQLIAYWGVLIGLGSGCLTMTFAATVAGRWFERRRGVVVGALSAASHLGQLLFLPALAWSVDAFGWRPAVVTLALAAVTVALLVLALLRDDPADVGARPYGAPRPVPRLPAPPGGAARRTLAVLAGALRTRLFWLLAGMFAVCGASTNGIMWSNWAPAAHDHGMRVTVAASMLSLIGVFSSLGALVSGWLTDRFDPRRLLTLCFAVRALTLLALPMAFAQTVGPLMLAFVVVYGVVDVATVPPVIALARRGYGEEGPIVFGWVNAAHQIGAGGSAFAGATARELFGTYDVVWTALAVACLLAALLALAVGTGSGSASPRGVPDSRGPRADHG